MTEDQPSQTGPTKFPVIRNTGLNGMLVTFADKISEPSNRAALAFHAALDTLATDQIGETSTSLASAFVRFDPVHLSHADPHALLADLRPPAGNMWARPRSAVFALSESC